MSRRPTGKLTLAERKKAALAPGSRTPPRKQALLFVKTEPESITGPILSALRKGATQKAAAAAGGLTMGEIRYIIELGELGHPAYREFVDEWLRSTAEPQIRVMEGVLEDATDPERRTIAAQKFALELMDPEAHGQSDAPQGGMPASTATFTVNINKDPRLPDVDGGVEDAEFEDGVVGVDG